MIKNTVDNTPVKKKEKNNPTGKVILWVKIIVLILILVALVIVIAGRYLASKFSLTNFEDVRGNRSDISEYNDIENIVFPEDLHHDEKVLNFLLVGVDNDYAASLDERGAADGLILLSLNSRTKQIVITSIMRDTWVAVPNEGSTKITLVYYYRGLAELINAVESNFGIRLDNYVLVNYLNVIDIIDAMGGLDLEITDREIEGMIPKIESLNKLTGDPPGTDTESLEEGLNHLNGKQVAAILRIRNTADDRGRTLKAREVLAAMKAKVKDMSASELNAFTDVVMKNITTDLPTSGMMKLTAKLPSYLRYDLVSNRIPLDDTFTEDSGFIYIDYEVNRQALYEAIYEGKRVVSASVANN